MAYYLVDQDLGKFFNSYYQAYESVLEAAKKFAESVGAADFILGETSEAIGGIAGLSFDKKPNENWIRVFKNYYRPKTKGTVDQELADVWAALPMANIGMINKAIRYNQQPHPLILKHGSRFVFHLPDETAINYEVPVGVNEIKISDYRRILHADLHNKRGHPVSE